MSNDEIQSIEIHHELNQSMKNYQAFFDLLNLYETLSISHKDIYKNISTLLKTQITQHQLPFTLHSPEHFHLLHLTILTLQKHPHWNESQVLSHILQPQTLSHRFQQMIDRLKTLCCCSL